MRDSAPQNLPSSRKGLPLRAGVALALILFIPAIYSFMSWKVSYRERGLVLAQRESDQLGAPHDIGQGSVYMSAQPIRGPAVSQRNSYRTSCFQIEAEYDQLAAQAGWTSDQQKDTTVALAHGYHKTVEGYHLTLVVYCSYTLPSAPGFTVDIAVPFPYNISFVGMLYKDTVAPVIQ